MLFPVSRYLESRRGIRQGCFPQEEPAVAAGGLSTPGPGYVLVAHIDEILTADGEELLPVHLLHLVRKAAQEVVQP